MLPLAAIWAIPWVKKATLYVGVGVAIFFVFRWWLLKHDDKVYQEGRLQATKEVEEKFLVEQAKTLTEIKASIEKNAADRATAAKEARESERNRLAIEQQLIRNLAESVFNRGKVREEISAIPASELDANLRAQSNKLAASNPPD